MKIKDYLNEVARQKEILDSIDFIPYLTVCNDLDDLMELIDANPPIELPADFEHFVFNFITTEEFADYLNNRYSDFFIQPITHYYIYNISKR